MHSSPRNMAFKILIVNPNSTAAMTEALKPLIASLNLHNVTVEYFTGPSVAPPSINDPETSDQSAKACLPLLIKRLEEFDGFLISCYSEHPLVPQLRAEISRRSSGVPIKKFVLGIFESSILHAFTLIDSTIINADSSKPPRWGIVTTGKAWEELLTAGVGRFLGIKGGMGRFAGVASTGVKAVELHTLPKEEVQGKMKDAVKKLLTLDDEGGKVTAICLGCAGMVGLEEIVKEASRDAGYPEGGLRVVDGVKAGVLMLEGILKGAYSG
ncbi:Asp/Glu/hydantoin racemase [Kalaharituber pfeilii]|nr:Asp/Glu/hydantoin racemase [Kalaharituber pfeilii]